MQSLPLVSIVMPSLNQVKFIGTTIDSVLSQDYTNIELIIADGGSNDGTVDLLKSRQAADSRLHWLSRADSGPAQAINSALTRARGTIVGWLNSDDIYTPNAIRRAIDIMLANPTWLMIYGHGQHIDAKGDLLDSYPTLPPSTPITQFAEGCFICQPTVFFRRSMWILLGNLDENLKTAFDFDYWLRAFLAFPERIGFVDVVQACSRLHEACITSRMRRTVLLEGMQVLSRHFGNVPKEWLITYAEELISNKATVGESISLRDEALSAVHEAAQWLRDEDLETLLFQFNSDNQLLP